jgi:hypothetical protein
MRLSTPRTGISHARKAVAGGWIGSAPFLSATQARGCLVQVGVDMLFEQIPAYLEFFGFPSTTPEHPRQLAEQEPTSTNLR